MRHLNLGVTPLHKQGLTPVILRGLLLICLQCVGAFSVFAQSSPLPLLTRGEQVRKLTPAEAQRGYPVRIRGVITDDVPPPDFFVQDATPGIYVEASRPTLLPLHFAHPVPLTALAAP